jgi:hypothetical protein
MGDERREDERVEVNLPVRYDGLSGSHDARLSDLSLGGCFVNTAGRVEVGEVVGLKIRMPDGQWLELRGEVATFQEGIGFGLLFTFLTDEEQLALRQVVV